MFMHDFFISINLLENDSSPMSNLLQRLLQSSNSTSELETVLKDRWLSIKNILISLVQKVESANQIRALIGDDTIDGK